MKWSKASGSLRTARRFSVSRWRRKNLASRSFFCVASIIDIASKAECPADLPAGSAESLTQVGVCHPDRIDHEFDLFASSQMEHKIHSTLQSRSPLGRLLPKNRADFMGVGRRPTWGCFQLGDFLLQPLDLHS